MPSTWSWWVPWLIVQSTVPCRARGHDKYVNSPMPRSSPDTIPQLPQQGARVPTVKPASARQWVQGGWEVVRQNKTFVLSLLDTRLFHRHLASWIVCLCVSKGGSSCDTPSPTQIHSTAPHLSFHLDFHFAERPFRGCRGRFGWLPLSADPALDPRMTGSQRSYQGDVRERIEL